MKRFTLLKTLLVAVGLCGGSSAWADGNKRTIDIIDYSTIAATDWSTPGNGTATLKTSSTTGTPSAYSQCYHNGSGGRGTYKNATLNYTPGSGYTTSELSTHGYNIEFDFSFSSGKSSGTSSHQGQFIVSTGSPSPNNYISDDATCLFSLSYPSTASGSTPENLYINDLANSTGTAVAYSTGGNTWLHLKLVITSGNVSYTLTKYSDGSTVASGSKSVAGIPSVNRYYALLGRGGGIINFTNYEVYDYTEEVTVSAPSFTFNKVDGANRNYIISNVDGSGTLYYTTSPAAEAPAVGNAAYTSTTETSVTVDFGESGNYYAYVLHTNGTTTSPVTTQVVTAGALVLAEPVFTIIGMSQAEDGFFYPIVTFASDNSSLEGSPTATFDKTSPYTFTATGSLAVTASATGYTSSSQTFTVSNRYALSNTIDFGTLTASDFDAETWTSATGAPRDYWTNRAAAIPADVTYYRLTNTSSTEGEPDNSAVLDGITISNYYQRAPEVYIGYGLLTPYEAVSGSGTNMNLTVNGGTASDYVVFNGWNNYGSGTFNTVLAGNATFGLYRYDTMLRTIKVYSPVPTTISATIGATGYTTFASAYPLNLSSLPAGLTAYYVSAVSESEATLTAATGTVAAGEGLILAGTPDESYNIPVAASGTAISGNKLKGCATATEASANDYVLANNGGTAEFQYLTAAMTVPAGKAYLPNSVFGAKNRLAIVFEGDVTGIEAIESTSDVNDGVIYNLAGQRVVNPTKGIFIKNGKKFIIK